MNYPPAFLAGAFAGLVVSVLLFLGRAATGVDVGLEMTWGTLLVDPGRAAWAVGLAMHVVGSGIVGIAYLWAFEAITQRAGVTRGLAVGAVHLVVAGIATGIVLPAVHRLIPEMVPSPGFFLASFGAVGVAAFVVGHLVYGGIVGAMCAGHVRRPRLTAGLGD